MLDRSQETYTLAPWVNDIKLRADELDANPKAAEHLTYLMYLLGANDRFVNYFTIIRRDISPKVLGTDTDQLMSPSQLYALIFGDYLDVNDQTGVNPN